LYRGAGRPGPGRIGPIRPGPADCPPTAGRTIRARRFPKESDQPDELPGLTPHPTKFLFMPEQDSAPLAMHNMADQRLRGSRTMLPPYRKWLVFGAAAFAYFFV